MPSDVLSAICCKSPDLAESEGVASYSRILETVVQRVRALLSKHLGLELASSDTSLLINTLMRKKWLPKTQEQSAQISAKTSEQMMKNMSLLGSCLKEQSQLKYCHYL